MLPTTTSSAALLFLMATASWPCAALHAQKPRVIPVANAATEGAANSYFPFTYEKTHTQQIWLGSTVTSGVALIKGLSFRRDTDNGSSRAAVTGRTFKSVVLSLGSTTVSPGAMSTTFSKNLGKSMTAIFTGNLVLPNQPLVTGGPANFNIHVPAAKPYIYSGLSGNLIFDFLVPGNAQSKTPYYVDAITSAPGKTGSATAYGTTGSFKSSESVKLTADTSLMAPGGVFDLSCGSFTKAYSGMLVLGISKTKWGASNLPLSLNFMGANGNSLYASLDFQLPFAAVKSGSGYASRFRAAIPNLALYKNVTLHTQAYYNDPLANAAGLVTTHGLTVNFSSTFAGPITNLLGTSNATQGTGFFLFGTTRFGGPVVRFNGVIP